ncbi:MAG: YlxR family protein [Pseudobutyrivibrio sp.]|nr:YlxR family protein [Pseudobutyrivibrio sp.]
MQVKELPLRKCVACGQMLPKDQLFRVVKTDEGAAVDLTYKISARGAYVCKNRDCIDMALKKKSFNRSLHRPVGEEVFDNLYMELENDR